MPMTHKMDILYQYLKNYLEEVELQKLKQFVNDFRFALPDSFTGKKYHYLMILHFPEGKQAQYIFTNPHWFKGLLRRRNKKE